MSEIKRAVIFMDTVPEDGGDAARPLILQQVLFCPILTWLDDALRKEGVERLFRFGPARVREAAEACFPTGIA